jgi:RimJ/RimL family protein N-acetyltransferase
MHLPYQIQTERLLRRPPAEADAPAIFERYGHNAGVARYTSWKPHQSIEDTLDLLRRIVRLTPPDAAAAILSPRAKARFSAHLAA